MIHDERTVQQVVTLLQRVLAQPDTKDALVAVLANAMQDGLGKEASIEYVSAAAQRCVSPSPSTMSSSTLDDRAD